MNNVPHWQWLLLLYFILVAAPVMLVHSWLKKKVLQNKTVINLLVYFITVIATAFIMHFIAMWLYFEFIFSSR